MKKGFRLTIKCLVYGLAIKSASVKTEINQRSAFSERARNAMNNRRRHPSTQQKRNINTSADLDYFYTEKSITWMSFRVRVTPFTSMLRARS